MNIFVKNLVGFTVISVWKQLSLASWGSATPTVSCGDVASSDINANAVSNIAALARAMSPQVMSAIEDNENSEQTINGR